MEKLSQLGNQMAPPRLVPLLSLALCTGGAQAIGLAQAPFLNPETALEVLSASSASHDVDDTLVEFGLSEPSDPLLSPMMSDPRYREEHGGRPAAPEAKKGSKGGSGGGGSKANKGGTPPRANFVDQKRKLFGDERASTYSMNMLRHLLNVPFEGLRSLLGVRGKDIEGIGGMMGKATPYGYDPFGPGQAWDPHMGAVNQQTMCRSLLDGWMRKCLAAPGAETLSLLQLSEKAGSSPGVMDVVREWKRGQPTRGDAPAPAGPATGPVQYQQPFQAVPNTQQTPMTADSSGEVCRRMLNDYIYKCDFSLM